MRSLFSVFYAHVHNYSINMGKQTFSRPCGDIGLHFWPVRQGFGSDAEGVGHAVCQVLDFHPEGSAALHIHCHNLTDTWSARRGVCTGDTITLDHA